MGERSHQLHPYPTMSDLRFGEKIAWDLSDFRLNRENREKKWIGDR